MTRLNPSQIAALWLAHGGSRASVVTAVAVAWAESEGNTDAESPSDDWGLWQINGIWCPVFGVTRHGLLEPDVNAYCAVRISGGGSNFAAWCTMWADPARDCGHGHITAPQVFSAAWNTYAYVLAYLGNSYPVPPSGTGQPIDNVRGAWDALGHYVAHGAPDQFNGIAKARATTKRAIGRML